MPRTRRSTRPAPLPVLPNKRKRLPGGLRLLPEVEAGIRSIARRERWSRSRVLAWLVHDWFKLNPETGDLLPGPNRDVHTPGGLLRHERRK